MAQMGRPRSFDRDEAIHQAMHIFWEHGYESTSLAQLKAGIGGGISAPSFYAAFGSKDPSWEEAFIRSRFGPLDAGHSMADLADGMVADLLGHAPDPGGAALARDCFAHVPDSTYRDTVLALRGFDVRDALGRIAIPTLLLAGSEDKAAPPAGMERMAGRIPQAQYVVLDGVGHLANLERPDAFNAAVLGFLKNVA